MEIQVANGTVAGSPGNLFPAQLQIPQFHGSSFLAGLLGSSSWIPSARFWGIRWSSTLYRSSLFPRFHKLGKFWLNGKRELLVHNGWLCFKILWLKEKGWKNSEMSHLAQIQLSGYHWIEVGNITSGSDLSPTEATRWSDAFMSTKRAKEEFINFCRNFIREKTQF